MQWPSLMKDMRTEQLLCWSGMTDTEHSITSGSNEEASQLISYYNIWKLVAGFSVSIILLRDSILS